MSENTQNNTPKKEQYSLNDDRRVKVLSRGALVAKRFFRNRPARTSSSTPTPRCPKSMWV